MASLRTSYFEDDPENMLLAGSGSVVDIGVHSGGETIVFELTEEVAGVVSDYLQEWLEQRRKWGG